MAHKKRSASSASTTVVECSHCGYRFVGEELVNKPCPNCGDPSGKVYLLRPHPKADEPVVEIYRAPHWLRAEMIREILQSQGIMVAFKTRVPWGIMTFTVDGLGEVGILALESEAERARGIIEEFLKRFDAAEPTEPEPEEEP
jgi:predicted  nucleic acid-binding Zn-ribbon protein